MKQLVCTAFLALLGLSVQAQSVVTVFPSETYQTMQDFGASDCWLGDYIGRYFSTTEREKAARWLFSREWRSDGSPEGIGLSCWRVNIGAGSATQGDDSNIGDETRRTECFLNQDGTYDWTRQAGHQWFMQRAKDYGVDHFLLFSNSAPIYYTKTGKANANNQSSTCNLKANCFDKFAEFLATVTEHFEQEGYNISYIDPVNEPQFDWKDGQEGSPWGNMNVADLVKQLDKSLQKRNLKARILVPEAAKLTCLYAGSESRGNKQIDAFFNPANTSTYVGNLPTVAPVVAGHSYWTFRTNNDLKTVRERVRDEAQKWGVEVMQTEWSMLDAAPTTDTGFPESYEKATKMDIALFMGKLIQCDLTFGNMSAWHYWTAFATQRYGQKNRFFLLRVNAQGDSGEESYGDIKKGGTITQDKNLWVLGNFSRFIRPGYRRVRLDGADDMNGLLGSAYLSPDGTELVTVFVNTAKAAKTFSLSLSGDTRTVTASNKYVTSASSNLAFDVTSRQPESMQVPARSVVTFVMTLATTDGIGKNCIEEANFDANSSQAKANSEANFEYTLNGLRATKSCHGLMIQQNKKHIK